jgi:hypothetical protein
LGRKFTERDYNHWIDRINLAKKEWFALLDLVRLRVAVPWRTALNHVGNIDLSPSQTNSFDDLRQKLSGSTNKGLSLRVLVSAWSFPNEHQVCMRIADAEHYLSPSKRVEFATVAITKIRSNLCKCAVSDRMSL